MHPEKVVTMLGQLQQQIQQIIGFINNFQQAIRLDSTGKEIRLLAIQRMGLKKGLWTEADLTEMSGEIIKEMQKQAEEEAAKTKIVPATPEQTAAVTNPAQATEAPATPPQA